jgi:hypothetical protein
MCEDAPERTVRPLVRPYIDVAVVRAEGDHEQRLVEVARLRSYTGYISVETGLRRLSN